VFRSVITIVLKPGPARRVDPGRVEEKTGKEKTKLTWQVDPVKTQMQTR